MHIEVELFLFSPDKGLIGLMQTGLVEQESLFIDCFVINVDKVITLLPFSQSMLEHVNRIKLSRVTLILFTALSVRINCDVCVKALEWSSFGI